MEEIAEVMSQVSLKFLDAPCIFYNLNGYYNDMKAMLDHMVNAGLSTPERLERVCFADDLEEIAKIIQAEARK